VQEYSSFIHSRIKGNHRVRPCARLLEAQREMRLTTVESGVGTGWRSSSPCVPKFPVHAGLHVPRVSQPDSYPQSHGFAEAIRNLHHGDCRRLRL
jgi:hypothetical protein